MSTHSSTRLWTHLIWETLSREPMLDKRAAAKAFVFPHRLFTPARNLHEDQLLQRRSHSCID